MVVTIASVIIAGRVANSSGNDSVSRVPKASSSKLESLLSMLSLPLLLLLLFLFPLSTSMSCVVT